MIFRAAPHPQKFRKFPKFRKFTAPRRISAPPHPPLPLSSSSFTPFAQRHPLAFPYLLPMATSAPGGMLVVRRVVVATDPAIAGVRKRSDREDHAMHPVPSIIRAAELRAQDLIAESERDKLARQAMNGMPAARDTANPNARVWVTALALMLILAIIVLIANAPVDSTIQVVASGP